MKWCSHKNKESRELQRPSWEAIRRFLLHYISTNMYSTNHVKTRVIIHVFSSPYIERPIQQIQFNGIVSRWKYGTLRHIRQKYCHEFVHVVNCNTRVLINFPFVIQYVYVSLTKHHFTLTCVTMTSYTKTTALIKHVYCLIPEYTHSALVLSFCLLDFLAWFTLMAA